VVGGVPPQPGTFSGQSHTLSSGLKTRSSGQSVKYGSGWPSTQ
jgi:hypothetical protein